MIVYCKSRKDIRPWMVSLVLLLMKWVCHTCFFYSLTGTARPVIVGYYGGGNPVVIDPCGGLLFYGKDPKGEHYVLEGSKGAYWD